MVVVREGEAYRTLWADIGQPCSLFAWKRLVHLFLNVINQMSSLAAVMNETSRLLQRYHRFTMNRILLLLSLLASSVILEAESPNILLIILDDIGIDSLEQWNDDATASFAPTPNIDALADAGIRFGSAYAYPTCSPTRASLITGRYGFRTGVLSPESADNFSADEHTLPEAFIEQELGYQLANFGKWHLEGGSFGPNELGGWPHFSGSLGGALNHYHRWDKTINGATHYVTETYATRDTASEAILWIRAQGSSQWFAWVAFNAAHTPLHIPPSSLHSYDLTDLDSETTPRPFYEAIIETLDSQIGRLISAVDLTTTTVILLGDNGTAADVIQPPYDILGRAKGSVYEGGTHVPFIIAGASVTDGNRDTLAPVHCADLFATILELAGGDVPDSAIDSRSLLPILENNSFEPVEECILVESDSFNGRRAIRNADYKLIRFGTSMNQDELYHIASDTLEAVNLLDGTLDSEQTVAYAALSLKLDSWQASTETVEVPNSGYPIVDTAQSNYYDDAGGGTIDPPTPGSAFAGQDAQYDGLQPAYEDNGDGTITDLNTGLMWKQDFESGLSLADAISAADTHAYAGYDDWRLPTLKELYSLILFTGETGQSADNAVPYLDTDYFNFEYGDTDSGLRYIDAQYLSSTEYIHTTMNGDATVFGVNFADGRIKGYPIYEPSSGGTVPNTYYARYVRGNTEYGINDFIDNGDGTVTDYATGLMWQQDDSGSTHNWETALSYAESLDLAGYQDWRLPNAKELQSIVDYTQSPMTSGTAAIDTNYFNVTETESFYWSSTTHLDGAPETVGNYAVYLSFGRALGWINEVLLDVHGAGAQRSDPKSGTPILESPGHGPQGDVLRIYNYVRGVRSAATAQGIDSDGDGLADWYEYNHSGSATAMLPHADADGDGLDNLDEARAGTSPTDSSSLFSIAQTEADDTEMTLYWHSELGQSYRIIQTAELNGGDFSEVYRSGLSATPPVNEIVLPIENTQQFYRIEVE